MAEKKKAEARVNELQPKRRPGKEAASRKVARPVEYVKHRIWVIQSRLFRKGTVLERVCTTKEDALRHTRWMQAECKPQRSFWITPYVPEVPR